jgi:hypothetical protein
MRELDPLSFDICLREAARELGLRARGSERAEAQLPAQLFDEETAAWLGELQGKDPLASALERWFLRIREQVRFQARRAELRRAQRADLHSITEPDQARMSLAELLQRSLARPRERAAYLRGYFANSGDVSELVTRLWEERQMFAEQLGVSLDSFEVADDAILPAARLFLAETQSAHDTLNVHDPETWLSVALAESADEGWPARLTPRTLTDLLADSTWFHGLRLAPFTLPRAHGPSSFLLALTELGRALADAATSARSPFVLARDVFDLQRQRVGALLGALPVSAAFATRRLGLSSNRVRDHLRALARTLLVDARVSAFRVVLRALLASGPGALRRELAEASHSALGFELPVHVAGAFIRVRPRDSQRFAGILLSAQRHEILIQAHDDDWFRNPRAIRELRAELGELGPESGSANKQALALGMHAFRARVEPLL